MTTPTKILAVTSTVAVSFAAVGWFFCYALVQVLDMQSAKCRGCVR